MKIDSVKINGFGKVKNQEIMFKDGINIVYGENESGKSTILKCIQAIFYGAAKTKNGKSISDFEKYKPWDGDEFSGKIEYTLDDGTKYKVFRDFKKKNPVIYNASNEDISSQFSIDKSKGINFLEEQTKIDETSFCNTAMISQKEVELGKAETNLIVQKISNLVSTGDDNISFKKSMETLTKMQNDAVGTQRTKNKPINIVESNIKKLLENKKRLISYKNASSPLVEKRKIEEELEKLHTKKEKLKNEKQMFQHEEIEKIEKKFKMKIYAFVLVFLIILTIILWMALKNNIIVGIPVILAIIDICMIIKMNSKMKEKSSNLDDGKIEKEIESLQIRINDLKFKNHILENEKANMDEKLEELARIEEGLIEQNTIREELISLDTSFNIAKECLEKAYDEVRHNISPKFKQKLCEITTEITDGKYKNISISDETGINVEVENGAYIPVEQLSVGTIDEMYLALRLSTLSEVSKENLPIFLDETFAYFDKNRLKNILCYLQDKNYENQIIIFTCSNREEEILNKLKIEYHLINLEK